MSWVGTGVAVAGLAGSALAADAQGDAAGDASGVTQGMFNTARGDLAPWATSGKGANVKLSELLGIGGNESNPQFKEAYDQLVADFDAKHQAKYGMSIWDPRADAASREEGLQRLREQAMQGITPSEEYGSLLKPFGMEDFQESPAYQFNLSQGMEAINKSAAAKGRYYAPATLQDIGKYSQGLASNEFQNAFNNYNTGQNNIYSRLSGASQQGQNAASQQGQYAMNAGQQIGENIMGAGNAKAAGYVGAANAIGGGAADAYNNYLLSQVLGQRQEPIYGV